MSETDNHWDAPLYLRCDCHTAHHAVVIDRDPDIEGCINVSVTSDETGPFWHRVKGGLAHIFSGERLVTADVILDQFATARLRDFCATILEKSSTQKPE